MSSRHSTHGPGRQTPDCPGRWYTLLTRVDMLTIETSSSCHKAMVADPTPESRSESAGRSVGGGGAQRGYSPPRVFCEPVAIPGAEDTAESEAEKHTCPWGV